jgi:hypothetical protein
MGLCLGLPPISPTLGPSSLRPSLGVAASESKRVRVKDSVDEDGEPIL